MTTVTYDYDLIVIGAGSGGVRAARMAATKGARVAIIESRYLGGTCVNVGCVPKKLFVYASEFSQSFKDAAGFGYTVDKKPEFEWARLRDNKTNEIKRLNGVYDGLLSRAGVDIIHGHGQFVDEHTVAVEDRQFSAKHVVIATGSWPVMPDAEGAEHIISSNEVFYLDSFPKDVIVIGGGYIAVEFAGIFNGLGAKTHLLHRGEPVLRGFDDDIREFVSSELEQAGIQLLYNREISKVEALDSGRFKATLSDGSVRETDLIVSAIGRRPLLDGLNIDKAGVKVASAGHLDVNEHYQTNVPHIFALGDVIGRVQLTPVALAEGMYVADYLFDESPRAVDYNLIPTAVFCQPNIGTVGMTEAEAAKQFERVEVYQANFKAMKNTLSGNPERTLMKLLVDCDSRAVIGAHMVGESAGEIIQGLAVAMTAGATKADFDRTIGIHPTAAEEFVTMRSPARIIGRDREDD
ncbi:glutathione-disulfide reductase [Saccharospirillum impatiens]|uniref:glutathione-disulfide reductase n=1 Tax=Saccharospirillum impatiens TaxID=169438 RepID=UPI001B7FB187|nr:glutathione-disulfide reductase [Saccharospirillum impatiens]